MTRLMALDVGEARIGVAISDSMRFLASPYATLHVTSDETQTWAAIQRCIAETEATGLLIGLPISLDGQIHAQGERVQAFAQRLKQHIDIPLIFWDERLSTVEAERLLTERDQNLQNNRQGYRGYDGQRRQGKQGGQQRGGDRSHSRSAKRRQKGHEIDALAATVILQEYLDSQGKTTEETTS